jgi:cysteine synthase A
MQLGCDLVKNEGLFVGISSCANILAADILSNTVGNNKRIITLAPDSGHIYLSHYLNIKNTSHA